MTSIPPAGRSSGVNTMPITLPSSVPLPAISLSRPGRHARTPITAAARQPGKIRRVNSTCRMGCLRPASFPADGEKLQVALENPVGRALVHGELKQALAQAANLLHGRAEARVGKGQGQGRDVAI